MDWLHELPGAQPRDTRAVIDHDGAEFSFGALDDMATDLARLLVAEGLRPGDRLVLISENSATYAVALLAASRARAWVVPVNARMSAEEIDAVIAHAGARMAMFTPEASAPARGHAERMAARRVGRIGSGEVLLTGPHDGPGTAPEPVEDDPKERVAVLLYTTGTTSAPKGVMLTHGNLMWNARVSAKVRGATPGDVVIGVLPGTHIFCLASVYLASLAGGSAIRFLPRFSASAVLDAFASGDTILPAVPQMYQAILQELAVRGERPNAPRLRAISSGGAPLDPEWKEKIEAIFGLPLNNGYGLTETSPGVASTRSEAPRHDTSVGQILEDLECIIDAPDAEGVGELLIRGPNIMKGYYRDPDRTREAIRKDGFFRTGDLAKIDPDGTLWIRGRKKELIIRSGFNVFPPEVEAMLTRHPAVRQAAVVGRTVPGNEEIVAFVLAAPGVDEVGLKGWLHGHLTGYKIPQHIFIVGEFPTAPTGKILKHKLLPTYAHLLDARDRGLETEPSA